MVDIMQEFKEAENKLYNKGYYVSNMVYNPNYYELSDKTGTVVIDYLSEAQIIQLSAIL